MAAANAKPWKQQAPVVLVAALLLLGLTLPLPGSAALLDACAGGIIKLTEDGFIGDNCGIFILAGLGQLGFAGGSEEDVGKCCGPLGGVIHRSRSGDDCACSLREAFAERKIDVDRVCKLDMTKEKCQAKEDAEKARADAAAADAKAKADAAQQREDELTKLGACDRLFERLAAGELSMISRDDDIIACRREMKTCPASCQV
jgi:hypothetical protein